MSWLRQIGALIAMPMLAAALAACAPQQELFVVFPNADGSSGAISVNNGKTTTTLDRPFASAEVRRDALAPTRIHDADLLFRSAFASRPVPPHHFTLHFENGSSVLTPDGVVAYHRVFDDIHQRLAYEIEVIGYTDTVGTQAFNQALSLRRAGAIRDRLIADGIAASTITATGRGKLELAIPTADQVTEPRNRRVEITVR